MQNRTEIKPGETECTHVMGLPHKPTGCTPAETSSKMRVQSTLVSQHKTQAPKTTSSNGLTIYLGPWIHVEATETGSIRSVQMPAPRRTSTLVKVSLTWLSVGNDRQALRWVHRGTPVFSSTFIIAVLYYFYVSERNTPL